MRPVVRACLLVLLVASGACEAPTEIVVIVDGEPARIAGLELTVAGHPGPIALSPGALPATLGLSRGSATEADVTVGVAGQAPLARAQLEFRDGLRQMLYIELGEPCEPECPAGQGCFRGQCQPEARTAPCLFVASVAESGADAATQAHGCFGESEDAGLRDAEPPDATALDAPPVDAPPSDTGPDTGLDAGCGATCERWTDLAVGPTHACGVRTDGTVWCWGSNDHGQLGDESHTPTSAPVRVQGLDAAVAFDVEVGDRHSCALTEEPGVVYCWGDGGAGQLGAGSEPRPRAAAVPSLSSCGDLALGSDFSCALCAGDVWCWGEAHDLANGPSTLPTQTPVSAMGITAGQSHVCAWTSDGGHVCWGDADDAVVGHANVMPTPVPGLVGLGSVAEMDAGRDHTCARLDDGRVTCWGLNAQRQCGTNDLETAGAGVVIDHSSTFTALSAGAVHSCAIDTLGQLVCWGGNAHRSVVDEPEATVAPTPVRGRDAWTSLDVGDLTTCGLRSDGARECYGYDATGVAGGADITQSQPQRLVPFLTRVSLGGRHACAQIFALPNRPTCWGDGRLGQRGDLSVLSTSTPPVVQRTATTPGYVPRTLERVSAGYLQTCAAEESSRDVFCWGDGRAGVVMPAVSTPSIFDEPRATNRTTFASLTVPVALGERHACAPLEGRSPTCWGFNDEQQLGAASAQIDEVADIAAGRAHTCTLSAATDVIRCWGANRYGQAVPGSTTDASAATDVAISSFGSTAPIDIAAGGDFSCATNGLVVVCWGRDHAGQLGNPVSTATIQVVDGPVGALLGVTAGTAHACTWTRETIWCWGQNSSGQLGIGALSESEAPTTVDLVVSDPIERVVAGATSTCAEQTGGLVHCWGSDEYWRLGLGRPLTVAP